MKKTIMTMMALMVILTGCATGENPLQQPGATQLPLDFSDLKTTEPMPTPKASATPSPTPSATATPAAKLNAQDVVTMYDAYANRVQPNTAPVAQVVSKGVNGQVSTIIGNDTAAQGDFTTDHPRFPSRDSKGNVYFLDGSQKTAKLRMFNGSKNSTVLDLRSDPVTSREGEFYKTGLQIVNDVVYFSSEENVYKLVDGRATVLDPQIKEWMKKNQYEYVYRMQKQGNDLVFMVWRKNYTYGFVKYKIAEKTMEEVLPATVTGSVNNFTIHDKGIEVSRQSGDLLYYKFFPAELKYHISTNQGPILDAWVDQDENIYYVLLKDKVEALIYRFNSSGQGNGELVAGAKVGYRDGIADQVEMAYPTDFTWDGSGYLFADQDNNSIRKLWLDRKPL